MPLLQITTNLNIDRSEADTLAAEAGAIVAREIGKPESVMMAVLRPNAALTFGSSGDPAALFEIEGIELSPEHTEALSDQLANFAEDRLKIPADRLFVKLTSVPRGNWAGNRKVF